MTTPKRPKQAYPPFTYRQGTGMTQEAFAHLLGVAPEHLSRMENGHALTRPGTARLAKAIHEALLPRRVDEPAEAAVGRLASILLDG